MSSEIDYELESIQTSLDAGQEFAFGEWQAAFEKARNQWRIDRARRLLYIYKSHDLDEKSLGSLRYFEATLFVNLGEWKKAQKSLEQSIAIRRKLGNQKEELIALNSLANLLRRNADTLDSAVDIFQIALQSGYAVGPSRVILLNGMGLSLYEKGDLEQAQIYFHEVLDLARQTDNQEMHASALHNLGSIAWTRGKLLEARELLNQAQEIQHANKDLHGEAETLNSLGLVEEGLGNWEDSVKLYKAALENMQNLGDFYGQSQVLVNLGNIYSLQNNIEMAILFHGQAFEIARELGNLKLQGQSLTALGDDYRIKGELDKAEGHLRHAIEIKTRYGETRSLKHSWQSLGATYHQQKRALEAQSAYEKALQIARSQNDRRMAASTLLNLSTLFTAQEKFQDAIPLLSEAKKIALAEEYNDCLAWIYEQEGDLELFNHEPNAAKILESFSLSLWHACQFNNYELSKLIQRLGRFWIAHAEDGEGQVSLWFCDSIIKLWQDMDEVDKSPFVVQEFSELRNRINSIINE